MAVIDYHRFARTRYIASLLVIVSAAATAGGHPDMSARTVSAGSQADSVPALYELSNGRGMTVRVTDFAATLTDVVVPDRDGTPGHVVLGFDDPTDYMGRHPKFGATVGRYANRIGHARFTLDGVTYELENNNKGHSIHGGSRGLNRQFFHTDTIYAGADTAAVVLSHRSEAATGGFPGNLDLTLAYKLTADNELILEYTATTDAPTVINLTNHSYFNLSGCERPVTDHLYLLNADSIALTDATGIPMGDMQAVAGTVYDFTAPHTAGPRIEAMGRGYDTGYLLRNDGNPAAVVTDRGSGRTLTAYTTEPSLQFYIPHSDMSRIAGHDGRHYGRYYGFCLEMQHLPDSPNRPEFPSTVLRPGQTYRQVTVYRFGIADDTNKHNQNQHNHSEL